MQENDSDQSGAKINEVSPFESKSWFSISNYKEYDKGNKQKEHTAETRSTTPIVRDSRDHRKCFLKTTYARLSQLYSRW